MSEPTAPALRPGAAHRLVRACLLDLYPSTQELPGLRAPEVDAFLGRLRAEATGTVWWGLVLAALTYQLAPLLTLGLPVPAAWLSAERRDRHADRCGRSRWYLVKQATFLLKTFGGACWGARPDIRARLAPPDAPLAAEGAA